MKTIPLFRTRLSNERLMSALVLVLLLYNLPRFLQDAGCLLEAFVLLAAGLILDAACQFLLHKRLMCAVPAAVTVLILFTLSPGVPLLPVVAAAAVSLLIGKAVWGGTGKNPLNPAMVGLVLLGLFYPIGFGFTAADLPLLLPATVLSMPFLLMRPFASIGYVAGMAASLLLTGGFSLTAFVGSGILFWSCLVITDPVTTTSKPYAGLLIGLLTGFVPNAAGGSGIVMAIGILVSNLLSFLADRYEIGGNMHLRKSFRSSQKIRFNPVESAYIDLSAEPEAGKAFSDISGEQILARIAGHHVCGCGGAAFSTERKIRAVLDSGALEKHLIINAAECDPGLIHDKWLLVNRAAELRTGIACLQKCIAFKSVTVAAKDFYGVAFDAPVQTHRVSDYYPTGAEKLLIRDIFGKTLALKTSPAGAGILILNVQTVYAVWEAVYLGRTFDSRFMTIADLDSQTGTVVRARFGTNVYETARHALPNAANLFIGGGAMGAHLADDDDIITAQTNLIAGGAVKGFREAACSQCDVCSMYCPAELHVRDMAHLVDANKLNLAVLLEPEKCMDCALCSAVCLAGRDQAARIRTAAKARKEMPPGIRLS